MLRTLLGIGALAIIATNCGSTLDTGGTAGTGANAGAGSGGALDCSSCRAWQVCESDECRDDCRRLATGSTDPPPWSCGKAASIRVACGHDITPPSDWECLELTPPVDDDFDPWCCGGNVPL